MSLDIFDMSYAFFIVFNIFSFPITDKHGALNDTTKL